MMKSTPWRIKWFKEEHVELCFLLSLMFFMGGNDVIGSFIQITNSVISIPYHIDKLIIYALVVCIIIVSMKKVLRSIRIEDISIILILLLFILISWFGQDGYDRMYFTILFNLSYGICAYFFFLSVSDYAKLIDCFSKLSLFLSVFITLQILISGMGGTMSYSQYLGYALLPAAIISINQFLRNRSIIHMINFVYTTILIISMGARWPLVCVILFLIVRSIISPTKLLRKVVLLTALIAIGFVVVYYLDALLDFLETAFRGTGLSMRTLIKIRQANFFEDSGRNDIWSYSVKTISNHLFVGVGIGKDRILIANYKKAPSLVTGYYPHNIILEILLHYGAFFGAIVIILMFLYVAISFKKAIKVARRKQDYAPIDSLVITFALGFFPLLVSGSYLGWVPFFIFLGVCTGIMRNHQLLSEESVLSEKII